MVKPVTRISVMPNLPEELNRLRDLAYNLRWSWDHATVALFRRLDNNLWLETNYNPVWMLGRISQERLQEAKDDPSFLASLDRVWNDFTAYMTNTKTWYRSNYGNFEIPFIAYFSMEFGLTACFRNYSGGLGVLSGDHLKSASDLDLPLVGVGLLYQEGYFEQYLNAAGYQQESYPINDYPNLPVQPVLNDKGERVVIEVPLAAATLKALAWKVQVGRVILYLLDANHPDNPPDLRDITDRLYGGDRRTRIQQEILLGIGGIRLLRQLGIDPKVVHMNEGHSAFLALERTRMLMEKNPNLTFEEARNIIATSVVYTIHTPVPAGLERFGYDLIDEYFPWMWQALGLTRSQFHDLGREKMGGYDLFSLPVMALKFATRSNGVSQLHGEVSREMWRWMFPHVPENEVPVDAVTNGIHIQTWLSQDFANLYDRYLSPIWREDPSDAAVWQDVKRIPDSELWRTHERRRERLVSFARQTLKKQLKARGASHSEIVAAEEILNSEALTICFARRFATYKRATLIFYDLERLKKIINNPDRPVQFIFAGKAHPHDLPGKELIQRIVQVASMPEFRNSIVFLENYDMKVASYMLQGADVWLNTPRRPKEASGTSGMKVIYNGGLNASILDGWWAEAYEPGVGWAIGAGEVYPPEQAELQDEIEAKALYNLLENDLIDTFYDRGRDGLPRQWIAMMKESISKLAAFFSTQRMVREYALGYYIPAYHRYQELTEPNIKQGLQYAGWMEKIKAKWSKVNIVSVKTTGEDMVVGAELGVEAIVDLGDLRPEDVSVQLYSGPLTSRGEITSGKAYDMSVTSNSKGTYIFKGSVTYKSSGERGISVRVLPKHSDLANPFMTGLITWAEAKE